MKVLRETQFAGLSPSARGKVRDIYDLGDKLLIVATDRLSAFDVILPTPIPDKGRVLTQLSLFWFDLLKDVIPNHVLNATEFPAPFDKFRDDLAGRSMLVRKTNRQRLCFSRAGPCSCEKQSLCRLNASCAATFQAPDGKTTGP